MTRVKVLHLRASNFYGGPERQLHFHARLAQASRFDITVSSFSERGEVPEFLEVIARDGIATYSFPASSAYDRKAVGRVREYLKRENINILCTHDYRTHFIGFLAKRSLPVKWVAFSRGWTQDNLKVRLYHWVEKILIRLADRVVAVSQAQKDRLQKYLVPERKISVVNNAIDTSTFEQMASEDLQAQFGFPKESIIAVSAGRFSREKGQSVLVEAGALAIKSNKALRIVMFGDGPDLERIRQLVHAYGCEDQILCPGFERNVLGSIKGADILVNPSLSEGLPNVVLEGMALGVPVLAADVGGVPELIADGITGVLVPPNSPDALARGLLRLAEQPDLRRQIAHAAQIKVRTEFTFEGQMAKLTTVYDEVTR